MAEPHLRFASRRDDAIAGLCGAWMVLGLFSDGWAHRNSKPETFFSPWHGLLYSGFAASALWMLRIVRRGQREGLRGRGALPVGYDVRIAGVALFGIGGLLDFLWHTVLGIEVSIEALLSPPHLVLLAGGLLMAAGPIVSTLARERSTNDTGSWPVEGAIVGALTFMVSVIGFFLMYLNPYDRWDNDAARGRFGSVRFDHDGPATAKTLAGIMLFSLITTLALSWLVRAVRVPRGGLLVLIGMPPLLLSALTSFDAVLWVVGPVAAGIAAELTSAWLYRRLRRSLRYLATWVGGLVLLTWLGMFAGMAATPGIGWSAALWSGSACLAALLSALTVLASAPAPNDSVG